MNWIYVDDVRVKHAVMMPGQVLQIGALRLHVEFTTGGDPMPKTMSKPKPKVNVNATQPMKTIRPEPTPPAQPEKPWWKRLLE